MSTRTRPCTCRRPSPIEYRHAGAKNFAGNIADARACVDWVAANGARRVALVGHSQGGAVALQCAAQRSRVVRGVCALASQTKGVPPTSALRALVEDAAMRVLVVHGADDAVRGLGPKKYVRPYAVPP